MKKFYVLTEIVYMPLIISLTGEHYEKAIINLNYGRCRM